MGQKVNPNGFRVGVIKDWNTRWYASKKDFADFLVEDRKIRDFVKKKYFQASISRIEIDRAAGKITVSTVHSAKGLEWYAVFIPHALDGMFPSNRATDLEEMEEERRLFYVVVTRAKKKLWVTYANTRYKFGQLVQNEPSRFIEELPEQLLDRSYAGGGTKMSNNFGGGSAFERMNNGFAGGWSGGKKATEDAEKRYGPPPSKKSATPSYLPPKMEKKVADHTPTENFVANEVAELAVGQKVEHQKFGFGEIIKMEGASHNPMALIKFETNGEKKILLNYARLRIVG